LPLVGVLLAVLWCYGTTVLLAVLVGFGVAVPLNGAVWAVVIVAFAALGVFGTARRPRAGGGPLIMTVIGLGLLGWVMLGAYSCGGEVLALALLFASAIWEVSVEIDGAGEEGSPPIPAHGSLRDVFVPGPSGFRFYHTHVRAGADLSRGQYSGLVGQFTSSRARTPAATTRKSSSC
jgi:hypothetical protein